MTRLLARSALIIVILLQFAAVVSAGTLDEYYLQQFGEAKNGQLQKAILAASGTLQEPARCGMPLKKGLRRDWNLLEQSTQKILAKQLAAPVLSGTTSGSEPTLISPSGRFKIHYTTTGSDAVPSFSWVQTVAKTFDDVAAFYSARQWQLAPTGGNMPYDVFLRDLAPQGYYGVTESDQSASTAGHPNAFSSWMELDNNFTDAIYKTATYSPLQSLQVTAAHEYHHAVQYGYSYYFDIWYAEATSTWMEDELYDDVNQLYSYIPSWFNQSRFSLDIAESTSTGGGYGRWIFNRYLAEQHGPAVVRGAWERLAALSSPDGNSDIPMVPVLESVLSSSYGSSLGDDFFGFAKRVYTRDWTDHAYDTSRIHAYTPVATYTVYPVNSGVTLPHYSFAFYKFTPKAGVSSLTISIGKSSGIQTALFKNGNAIAADGSGFFYSAYGLVTSDEVALLIANSSSIDGQTANFSTDGSLPPIPVTGSCGSASNGSFSVAPVQNLCGSGTASDVTGDGPWGWNCLGSNGGTTAICSAQVLIIIKDATITSGNGTITSLNELALTDSILSPATKPANIIPTGAIDLAATVTSGSTVTIQLSNLTSLPMNPVFYKVVGTKWIKLQTTDYILTGSLLTFKVTDNGPYDSDARLGFIQGPLVVGIDTSPSGSANSSSNSGSGCFIATAAYGSYLHPQVQRLRNFRDDYLLTNAPGRAFVALYYHFSPPLADFIAKHEVLRVVTRLALTPLVFAVVQPLIAIVTLLLFGALLLVLRRRIKIPHSAISQSITSQL